MSSSTGQHAILVPVKKRNERQESAHRKMVMNQIVSSAGEFMWLEKSKLRVDVENYQRQSVLSKAAEFAKNWSWMGCGTLCVGLRDSNGEFYVFDGQHRKMAADLRNDIQKLPCLVFEGTTVKEEAEAFLQINANRRPLLTIQKFNAYLTSGNSTAIKAKELIDQCGRKLSSDGKNSGPGVIGCLGMLMDCIESDESALRRIWPMLCALCEGHPFHGHYLQGFHYIERKLAENEMGISLSQSRWKNRILKIGYDKFNRSIANARSYFSRGGAKVYASGIQQAINHGLRTDKLEYEDI